MREDEKGWKSGGNPAMAKTTNRETDRLKPKRARLTAAALRGPARCSSSC